MSRRHSHDRRTDARRDRFASSGARSTSPWWAVAIALSGVGLVATVLYEASSPRTRAAIVPSPGASLPVLSGDVRLDTAQFNDGQARFYRYQTESGKEIRFFVIKSSDGVIRAALDTCDVCYRARKGYRQVGSAMACNTCGNVFPSATINVSQGGCHPVPLQRTVDGTHLVLAAAALETGVAYF